MKVTLRKITKIPLDFEIKSDEITFKGYLVYDSNKLILLKAKLSGEIDTECDICADEFKMNVDEDIEFFLHSGVYKGDDTLVEVVECIDDIANLDDIMISELELVKSDYKCCENCK